MPLARARAGIWEGFLPGIGEGTHYKYRITSRKGGYLVDKADPYGYQRAAARDGVDRLRARPRLGRRRLDAGAPREQRARGAPVDLRGAPRVVDARAGGEEPLAHLSRARGQAGGARHGLRLHAHRAHAGRRAPVLSVVGLPGDGLLRADLALRHARGLHVVRRLPAPAGHRRHPRLDARALPHRRARAHLLRRHAPLRARRPAQGHPRRVGQRDLQLRPQRGAQLPHLERELLAGPLPPRRAARRRRRLDAVPRLRAAGGDWVPISTAGARTSRPSSSCARSTRRPTATTRARRRSPRSRRRGPGCRAPRTRAGSASA